MERGADRRGAAPWQAPGGGSVVAPNLTPGNLDGVVKWTDAQIRTAVTKGVRPDGGKMVGVMDFDLYEKMQPEDLDSIVAYVRALKPAATGDGKGR